MVDNNNSSGNTIEWGETQRGITSISSPDPEREQSTGVNNDPQGDTFGFSTPQLDIESIGGTANNDNLNIRLDFFTPIAPPSSFLPESVVGYIDLDLDQNPATGISSYQSGFAPPDQQGGPLGDEAFIDLFSESSGLVNLVRTTDFTVIAQIPISYGADFLELQIPLELLEDSDGVNFGTIVGTFAEPTDAAPNTEFATVTLPPPPPIIGTEEDDVLIGTNRGELIDGLGGNDILRGLGGKDQIFGRNGNDLITGGNGLDTVEGGLGNDNISGNSGDDNLSGNEGRDDLLGGEGNDVLNGGANGDRLLGDEGDDTLSGEAGNDTLEGGEGNDSLNGGTQRDRLFGGSGDDNLVGEAGADSLTGGLGNDSLDGGAGNDRLIGVDPVVSGFGAGEVDVLTGLSGSDTFVLGDATRVYYSDGDPLTGGESDYARIADFNPDSDFIELFGAADLYSLDFFTSGTGTTDAALIYDPGVSERGELIGILQNVSPALTVDDSAFSFV